MADVKKQNNDQQEQCIINDKNISFLFEQIYEELIHIRQDDLELTEQLTSLYDSLCHLRQMLTNPQTNSNINIAIIPIQIDSPTSSPFLSKPRSDSVPNILTDRQHLLTVIDDIQ